MATNAMRPNGLSYGGLQTKPVVAMKPTASMLAGSVLSNGASFCTRRQSLRASSCVALFHLALALYSSAKLGSIKNWASGKAKPKRTTPGQRMVPNNNERREQSCAAVSRTAPRHLATRIARSASYWAPGVHTVPLIGIGTTSTALEAQGVPKLVPQWHCVHHCKLVVQ